MVGLLASSVIKKGGNIEPFRYDGSTSVLVCSRGGVGLLEECMELVVKLFEHNSRAQQRNCHAVGKLLREKVVVGPLIATMYWHSSCMKTQDIARTYKSVGKDNLCMEICENILQVQEKQMRRNIKAKRNESRRRKREKEIKQTVKMGS